MNLLLNQFMDSIESNYESFNTRWCGHSVPNHPAKVLGQSIECPPDLILVAMEY